MYVSRICHGNVTNIILYYGPMENVRERITESSRSFHGRRKSSRSFHKRRKIMELSWMKKEIADLSRMSGNMYKYRYYHRLTEYAHKHYPLFRKKVMSETNILTQIYENRRIGF